MNLPIEHAPLFTLSLALAIQLWRQRRHLQRQTSELEQSRHNHHDLAQHLHRERSERRAAQEAQAHAQHSFLSLAQNCAEGVVRTNAQGQVEYLNPAAAELVGTRMEDAKGRDFESVVPLRHYGDEGRPLQNVVTGALERSNEPKARQNYELLQTNGLARPVTVTVTALGTTADSGALVQLRPRREPAVLTPPKPVDDRSLWERRIKDGLRLNRFHLISQWLQPSQRHAAEGRCFELLLRLEDEEGFWSEPARFMPHAEKLGLITAIDRWVLRSAFQLLRDHASSTPPIGMVGVNISPQTLSDPETMDLLIELLARNPDLRGKLCLELNEPAWLQQPASAGFCAALHRLGVRLAMDGYNGGSAGDLDALSKLPLDLVKLDARALSRIAEDPLQQELAQSAVRMARMQSRRVAAVCVEDARALNAWRNLGVDYVQGHALAKPTPIVFSVPMQ